MSTFGFPEGAAGESNRGTPLQPVNCPSIWLGGGGGRGGGGARGREAVRPTDTVREPVRPPDSVRQPVRPTASEPVRQADRAGGGPVEDEAVRQALPPWGPRGGLCRLGRPGRL